MAAPTSRGQVASQIEQNEDVSIYRHVMAVYVPVFDCIHGKSLHFYCDDCKKIEKRLESEPSE